VLETRLESARDVLTGRIIGAAIEVHRSIGPGLLESAYQTCLAWELTAIGCRVDSNIPLPLHYKGVALDAAYRIDLIVDQRVILELKSITRLLPVHEAQLLTYLKLSGVRTGLLINFNVPVLKDGIRRIVL
jgi:GxxExxY protein